MDKLEQVADLLLSTTALLTAVNANVRVIERTVVALAASHHDKAGFLKEFETEVEKAIVSDLYGPCGPDVIAKFEEQRHRVGKLIRDACGAP